MNSVHLVINAKVIWNALKVNASAMTLLTTTLSDAFLEKPIKNIVNPKIASQKQCYPAILQQKNVYAAQTGKFSFKLLNFINSILLKRFWDGEVCVQLRFHYERCLTTSQCDRSKNLKCRNDICI